MIANPGFVTARKDHPHRNQEQHDPAGDAKSGLGYVQGVQQKRPGQQEHYQHAKRYQQLAKHDTPAAFFGNVLQGRQEQRDIAQRVHH